MHQSTPSWRRRQVFCGLTRRSGHVQLLLILLLALLAVLPIAPASAQSDQSRVLPQLQNEAAAQPEAEFRIIVQHAAKDAKADEKVKELGGTYVKKLSDKAFVALVKGDKIAKLGEEPFVTYISPDALMRKTAVVDSSRLATVYAHTVNAAGIWSSLTGAGVGVAILDTGIPPLLDFKNADGGSRIVAKVLFNSSVEAKSDGHGHGTHVAGIVAGNSWMRANAALQGKYVGIAPEARLISVRVSDDNGMAYTSDIVRAIDWVIAYRQTYNIRVMNLSLVSSVAESYKTSILDAAVERAWFNGIMVVVAAGNTGPDTLYYPPANDPFVVAVGAADPLGTSNPLDDVMAPWSSYGTTQDGFSKPDVVAPGRYIVSVLPSGDVTLAKAFPERIVDGNYIWMSGTSMAAPVVAGVAALAFQAHPEWTNDQMKWLLQQTATTLGPAGAPLPGQGAGQINAQLVTSYAGIPQTANQGLLISDQLIGPNGETIYASETAMTSSSWSTSSWSTSSWSTSSWSSSSWSTSSWSTAGWASADEQDVK